MSIRSNVDPRRLDQRVEFQRNTPTETASGAQTPNWQRLVKCWASVDGAKASGAEPYLEGGRRTPGDYVFWIRADVFTRYGLTPVDRIVWRGKLFNISDIPDQQLRGRLITVIARTGINEG